MPHAGQHEGQAGFVRLFIVEQQIVFGDATAKFNDFRSVSFVDTNAFVTIGSVDERLAVFQIDNIFLLDSLF